MKKNKKIMFAVLLIIVVIVCIVIGTMPSEHEKRFKDIVKKYDNVYSERLKDFEGANVIRCYKSDENICFIAFGQGYEDIILIFAEFSSDSVEKVKILYHNETEGYGDLVVEDWFLQRLYLPYKDKLITVKNKKENANEVIAITGATLTSEAVVNAINECAKIMEEIENEQKR